MTEPVDHAGDGGEEGVAAARAFGITRPVVLPETFDGNKSWDEWIFHFESVAAVNGWNDEDKLKWLRVRMTGRAQKALHLLPEASRETYTAVKAALKARFDPASRHTRYQAEFQTRRKKPSEGWADFADDLKGLVDKGYPTLQEEAREQLAVNAFLQQLSPPQVAFGVKQKRPSTLDDAVAATLELESYTIPSPAGISLAQPEEPSPPPVSHISGITQLTEAVERLTAEVQRLKQQETRPRQRRSPTFSGECWRCRQAGHRARECPQNAQSPPRKQGN